MKTNTLYVSVRNQAHVLMKKTTADDLALIASNSVISPIPA